MSLTQELKNLAMVDIFTEAKKTDLFIGRPYYLVFLRAHFCSLFTKMKTMMLMSAYY